MDITPIVNAVIQLVAVVITIVVIPKVIELLNEKIGKEKTDDLLKWIDVFVRAAEQTIESGPDKKSFVLKCLQAKGFKITDDVDNAVEAAVQMLYGSLKQ